MPLMNAPLVFTSGSTVGAEVCVEIGIKEDGKLEDDERFTFSLTSTDPVVLVTSSGSVTIVDNDSKFSFTSE